MVTTPQGPDRRGGRGVERLVLAFDDERAVANAGLVLASTLAERLGIEQVVDETLELGERAGAARPGRKLLTLVISALVGGDSIEAADVLRCGETQRVLGHRVMAPRRWGRSCARSRSGTCVSSTVPSRRSSAAPGRPARGQARSRSRSISTRRSSRSPGAASRGPAWDRPGFCVCMIRKGGSCPGRRSRTS
jgi:hypothetical protein